MMYQIVCILIFTTILVCEGQQYTNKYDNVNLDQILRSDRLLRNYLNCLLDKGRCTPDAAELKKVLPDALQTACSSCNQKQQESSRKVIKYLIENRRGWWNELERKYDPQRTYIRKYQDELVREGIKY